MPRDGKYVVAYDITDDKERDKVEKILKNYGFRIQKSVFECRLTKSGLNRLTEELKACDTKSGFTRIYKVYKMSKPIDIGDKKIPDFDDGCAFIV
jgi:CRISPR-associated protein Cas2